MKLVISFILYSSFPVVKMSSMKNSSYSECKRLQQQIFHLLWGSQYVSHDVNTDPGLAQFLNISLHSSAPHQLRHLLARSVFPDKGEAQTTATLLSWSSSAAEITENILCIVDLLLGITFFLHKHINNKQCKLQAFLLAEC